MRSVDGLQETVLETLGERLGLQAGPEMIEATLASLGLDSLATLRWRGQLSAAVGVELPLAGLTGSVTVREVLGQLRAAEAGEPEVPGGCKGADELNAQVACPPEATGLTVVQQAYWSGRGADFHGGGVATFWYHEYDRGPEHRGGREIEGDIERLETAWKRVVALHPMLRTVIDRNAQPVIARHDVRDWTMPRHDLRSLSTEQAEHGAQELRHRYSHQLRPADQWPLVDVRALLLPGNILRLCVGFDALLVDFAAWGLVMRQWGELVRRPRTQIDPAPRDFAEALEDRATDKERHRRRELDRSWWQQQEIPPPPLPQAVFPETGTRFRRRRQVIDKDTWETITSQARLRGVSATTVVLTAFALACGRWGGTGDRGFSLNLTVFDRPDGFEEVVGDFSTTALLPLTRASGFRPQEPDPFTALATAVNQRFWEVLDHGSYGGVEVARERSEDGPWSVVFTSGLGQTSGTDDRWLGKRVFGVSQTPQVLWDHLVWEEDGVLILTHDVVEGALDEAVVDGICSMQLALLRSLIDDTGWDRAAPGWDPLAESAVPVASTPGCGPLLHDPWVEIHGLHADSPGLLGTGLHVTHRALARSAAQVAERLARCGVGRGDLVLIALPKGADQLAAVLGTVVAGAGYVPADPTWPTARFAAIRERTGLRWALTDESVELPDGVLRVPLGSADVGATDVGPVREGERGDPSELAYVIFTSGSTGQPKGVAIEHSQARTTINEINHRFGITAADRVFAISALSFDLSVYDVFGVLGVGGALVLPEQDRLRDPQHWLELMAVHGVTVWNSAPPLMEMLLEYAESVPEQARSALAGLRHCLLSGDWIPVTLPDRLRALAPEVAVHSLGGATEASIWSITYPIGEVDPDWPSIPYGRALPGQSFWILDEHSRPVTVGEPGELHIGGDGVAQGYIGAPELTAERFLERPDLGTRLYRTGDLGRWRTDGTIEFLGRTDRQVKIGGHRIELGEVETVLLRLPQVRQAVASSVPGPDGRPRLVAHVSDSGHLWHTLPAIEQRAVSRELTEALRSRLPVSMIPGRFVLLKELPMTDNGKVDYKALPNPFGLPAVSGRLSAAGMASLPNSADELDSASVGDRESAVAPLRIPTRVSGADREVAEPRPRGGLRQAVTAMLGAEVPLNDSLTASGVTSLQAVRLANLAEDHGLPRPTMRTLLADVSLESLLRDWEEALTETSVVPTEERRNKAYPRDSTSLPAESTLHASGSAPSANASALPAVERQPAIQDLAARLRRAADLLDEAFAEISVVAPLFGLDVKIPGADVASRAYVSDAGGASDAFDLTEMQLAYLLGRAPDEFGRELAPHFYTEAIVVDLDPDRLRAAWGSVVAAHPMLRAVLTTDTRQRVSSRANPVVEFHDQRHLSAAEQQRERERLRAHRSHRQLPTDSAPMVRLHAARLDERSWRLTLDLDLLFCDAASALTIVEELATRYRDQDASVAPPRASFAAWVCETADTGAEARGYWEEAVRRLPDPVTPPLEPTGEPARFVRRRFELSPDRWSAVQRAAAQQKVTTSCLILDSLGAVLSPREPGTVMLTLSRRPLSHHGVVGDYTATIPVAIGPATQNDSGRMGLFQERLADDLEHALGAGGVHGNDVLRMLRAADRPSRVRVAVSCVLEPVDTDPSQLLDVLGRTEYAISQTPQVLVDIQLFAVGGRLVCNVDADESVVPPAWVDQVFDGFARQLVMLSGSTADLTRAEGERSPAESLTNPNSDAERLERVRSDVEEVFGELLGDTRLEHHRTWFDQGATSVTLVSAQRRLQERGYVIDIVDLFARPTPADTIALLVAPTLDPAPAQVSVAAAETPGSSRVSPREGHHRSAALAAASRRGRRRRAVR